MLRTKSILFHDDIFSKTKEGIILVGIILVVMILVGIIMVGNVIVGYGRYYCYIDPQTFMMKIVVRACDK